MNGVIFSFLVTPLYSNFASNVLYSETSATPSICAMVCIKSSFKGFFNWTPVCPCGSFLIAFRESSTSNSPYSKSPCLARRSISREERSVVPPINMIPAIPNERTVTIHFFRLRELPIIANEKGVIFRCSFFETAGKLSYPVFFAASIGEMLPAIFAGLLIASHIMP